MNKIAKQLLATAKLLLADDTDLESLEKAYSDLLKQVHISTGDTKRILEESLGALSEIIQKRTKPLKTESLGTIKLHPKSRDTDPDDLWIEHRANATTFTYFEQSKTMLAGKRITHSDLLIQNGEKVPEIIDAWKEFCQLKDKPDYSIKQFSERLAAHNYFNQKEINGLGCYMGRIYGGEMAFWGAMPPRPVIEKIIEKVGQKVKDVYSTN